MQFDWSGSVSAFPDDQVSAFHDWLANVLPSSVTGAIVSIGAVNQGERTVDIQGNYSGSGDAQSEITAAVQSSGMLDINSIQFSSEIGLANSSGAIPFTDNQPPVFQPVQMPVAILGNPAINPDGSINPAYNPKPMVIDYSAPNAPPPPAVVPVVVTQAPVKTGTTDAVIGGRTGTVTRQGPLPMDAGNGDINQLPINVIPSTPPPPQLVYSNTIPSGTPIHWQGNVSPVPDNYVSATLLAIQSALRAQGQDPDISLGVTNPNTGTQPLTVNTVTTSGFNSGNDAAASISSVVSSVTNLDPTSVSYTLNAGPAIVPVVVTTTPSVPIPTQPTPQLPMQPLNNPIYVPAQQVGVTTPGIPPPSPDPASTIVSGTPIQTPNIPAPTTTITVPVPAASDTINILGVQVSKTFAIIAALGVGYLLLSSGSKR